MCYVNNFPIIIKVRTLLIINQKNISREEYIDTKMNLCHLAVLHFVELSSTKNKTLSLELSDNLIFRVNVRFA